MHMHVNNVPPVPEDHLLPAIGSLPFPLSSTFARVPCLFQKQVSSLPAGDDPTNSSPTYHLAQQDTEQRGSSSCDEEQLSSGGYEEEEALVQDGRVNLRGSSERPLKSHVPMQALRKVTKHATLVCSTKETISILFAAVHLACTQVVLPS